MIDVVIVAAGKGTRMQPFTFEKPKALVPIKDKPLLQHQIDALEGLNIGNLIIVTGYMRGTIKAYLYKHNIKHKIAINKIYKRTECGRSLICGLRKTKRTAICIVGDLLFTKENIKKLIESKGNSILVREPKPSKLGQKVEIVDSFISNISLGGYNSYQAEAVGPVKLSKKAIDNIIYEFDNHSSYDFKTNVHCYSLLGSFANELKMKPIFIDDKEWMEIDSHFDWKIANRFWNY